MSHFADKAFAEVELAQWQQHLLDNAFIYQADQLRHRIS